jgi:hypothetical protein
MVRVSTLRLSLLRAGYLLLVIGLGMRMWPALFGPVKDMELMEGAVTCMLWALSVLAILGLRYPLQMLPLLLFETLWKLAWLLTVALPHWSAGQMDSGMTATAFACLLGVIYPIIIPWGYVFETYLRGPQRAVAHSQ